MYTDELMQKIKINYCPKHREAGKLIEIGKES